MSGRVSKYCSILNYLKDNNKDLYELVQELCLGRIFSPKRGGGITFLNPDKELTKKLLDMASDEGQIESAVEHIRSLVVLEHLTNPREVDGKTTHLKKKLNLGSECKVSEDPKFKPREFRNSDLAVFKLSGALIPTTGDASEESAPKPAKRKAVKGGGEIDTNRCEFFERIFDLQKDKSRNAALEVLISLVKYFENEDKQTAEVIKSQMSYDALTSLAIVLRPYSSDKKDIYITNTQYLEWQTKYNNTFALYSYVNNPYATYQSYIDNFVENNSTIISNVANKINQVKDSMTKVGAQSIIKNASNNFTSSGLSQRNDPLINLAEAELRAIAFNYFTDNGFNYDENFYKQYKLDKLGICDCKTMDLAFYYSVPYLMCRSSIIYYLPGLDEKLAGNSDANAVASDAFVNVDKIYQKALSNSNTYYENMQTELANFIRGKDL